jgi:hypothetical protein
VTESRDFSFNSRRLSVRAAAFSEGWRIRVFEGDHAATAVVYTVTLENTADACQDGRQEAQARGEILPEVEEREFLETPRYEEIEEYLEDEEDYLPTVSEEEFSGRTVDDEEAR